MSPRSILKRAPVSVSPPATAHAVHFPPSPSLCRTFAAYPPTMYDRTPIVVSKNNCALPERGCPGRTYVLEEQRLAQEQSDRAKGSSSRSYHPRAFAHSERAYPADLPQLVPDMSSESDESDGFTPSPQMPTGAYSYGAHGLPTKYQSYDYTPCDSNSNNGIAALAFLPYPPSPPANYHTTDDAQATKSRKKRSESRRRHDGAADLDRIRSNSPKPASSRRREYLLSSYSGFAGRDDGCLGGF